MTKQNVVTPAETVSLPPLPPHRGGGPVNGCSDPIKNKLMQLDVTIGGGGRIGTWVDSMKASSPTHAKAAVVLSSSVAEEHAAWAVDHPSALAMFEEIVNISKGKQIVMFLDYDGTLSPIVDNPDQAYMSDAMRAVVRKVARHFPTAIVTGRCRKKVYSFVRLGELYYAGSHGMDIQGPIEAGGHLKAV